MRHGPTPCSDFLAAVQGGMPRRLRASWVISLAAIAGCSPHFVNAYSGLLAPVADSVRAGGAQLRHCVNDESPAFGPTRSCLGQHGDTVVFVATDTAGRVLVVNRNWETTAADARAVGERIEANLTQKYGPGRVCPAPAEQANVYEWQSDKRWQAGNTQIMVWTGAPEPRLNERAFVQIQQSLGLPNCRRWFHYTRVD